MKIVRMSILCDVKSWLCACNQKLQTGESKDTMGEVSNTHQERVIIELRKKGFVQMDNS